MEAVLLDPEYRETGNLWKVSGINSHLIRVSHGVNEPDEAEKPYNGLKKGNYRKKLRN